MSRRKLYSVVGSIGALAAVAALAVALVFSQGDTGPAGSSPGPVASAVTVAQPSGVAATYGGGPAKDVLAVAPAPGVSFAAPAPSGGGPAEGIKVHGHWTIEVREPDGTLVSRTEFENALHAGGAIALSGFLARTKYPGFWVFEILPPSNQPGLCAPAFPGSGCYIWEPASPEAARTAIFKNLTLVVPPTGQNNAGKLVLSGNFTVTAQANSSVGFVGTLLASCPSSTPCVPVSTFTTSFLSSPVAVTTGQIIQVTVVISFS